MKEARISKPPPASGSWWQRRAALWFPIRNCSRTAATSPRIVPKLDGTGGKTRLGRISKAGDRYLRRLFVLGATSLLRAGEQDHPACALGAGASGQALVPRDNHHENAASIRMRMPLVM